MPPFHSSLNRNSRTVRAWTPPYASTFLFTPNRIFRFQTLLGAVLILFNIGSPGQQHTHLLTHNGQLLIDPTISSAGVGGERKIEGVAMMVTDSGCVIHHPRPWPGIGVGLVGLYNVPKDMSGDNVRPPSDDTR